MSESAKSLKLSTSYSSTYRSESCSSGLSPDGRPELAAEDGLHGGRAEEESEDRVAADGDPEERVGDERELPGMGGGKRAA